MSLRSPSQGAPLDALHRRASVAARPLALALLCSLGAACGATSDSETNDEATPATAEEADETPERPPNVLLICIDDLRPELGCYGATPVVSPNLDAFAATSLRFDRHYVQHPTCGASRFAFLLSRTPSEAAHFGNGAFAALGEDFDPATSLPGAFRAAGYHTAVLGKVSHSHDGRAADGSQELPGAWDELPTDPGPWGEAKHLLHAYGGGRARIAGKSPISENAYDDDHDYPDAHLADQAVATLGRLEAAGEPFFLAVGFFKPHLPFAAPRKYWELYERGALPLSPYPDPPADLPDVNGWGQSGEVTGNYLALGYANRTWSESDRRHLRHGYLACVSYVDAQVGKLLREVDELGLTDDTLVVVWGDHGWHLGDLGLFGKHTPYEASMRSALLMRVPGVTPAGQGTRALVESVDIFPTLAELCDVPVDAELAGRSFAEVLATPNTNHRITARSWSRHGQRTALSRRSRGYRHLRWTDPDGAELGIELYSLHETPFETRHLADEASLIGYADELGLVD